MRLVITSSVANKTFGSVEMSPNRSHNFYLPSWGKRRLLRCVKDVYDHHHSSSRSNHACKHDRDHWDIDTDQRSPKKAKTNKDVCDLDEGIEVVRENSMFNLETKKLAESEIAEEMEVTVAVFPAQNAKSDVLKNVNENKAAMDANQRSSKKANKKSDKYNKAVCDLDEGIIAIREQLMVEIKTMAENMKLELFKQCVESEIAEEENEVTMQNVKSDILKNGNENKAAMDSNQRSSNKADRKSDKCNKAVRDLDEGIEAIREQLMVEITTGAENMKLELFKQCVESEIAEEENEVMVKNVKSDIWKNRDEKKAAAEKQRNMRTRRSAACKDLNVMRAEFSLALPKKEIDEDFWKIVGRKPPRYPKKRSKTVQNDLDKCFPGTYFKEARRDMYN